VEDREGATERKSEEKACLFEVWVGGE